jgi:hypothetical protein
MATTPRAIVQTLIEDEDMPTVFASLVVKASKISDAAAGFIDAADKAFADDKKGIFGRQATVLSKAMDICQEVIKEGAAVSKLLRNPFDSDTRLTTTTSVEETQQTIDDLETEDAVTVAGSEETAL